MATISRLVLFIACLVFADSPAAEPSQVDPATLTVTNLSGRQVSFYAYRNAADCSGGQVPFGASKLVDSGASVSRTIPAGQDFSFYLNFAALDAGRLKYCNVPATFVPQSGMSYSLALGVDAAHCALVLADAAGRPVTAAEGFRLREWKQAWSSKGSWCRAER